MRREEYDLLDLLIAVLIALIVVGNMGLAVTVCRARAADARVEAVMEEAQARIDAYYASLPAQERPVVVSAEPEAVSAASVVTVTASVEVVTDWYIEAIPLEPELQKALWDACQEFNIDYTLALAVIEQETDFQNIHGDGGDSVGYFQVQPRWWGELMEEIGVEDLTDPVDNFRTGCAVLRELLDRYGGSTEDALTAYNTGRPGRSEYASAVMERAEGMRKLC